MKVKIQRCGNHNMPLPEYKTAGASGFDLRAVVTHGCDKTVTIPNGGRYSLPCGFAFEVPEGYELQVRPRSGLSAKGIVGTFGTVDSDYRGEVRIILTNQSGADVTIDHGDRVAQGVIAPVVRATFEEVAELAPTQRGTNGFGSSGVR